MLIQNFHNFSTYFIYYLYLYTWLFSVCICMLNLLRNIIYSSFFTSLSCWAVSYFTNMNIAILLPKFYSQWMLLSVAMFYKSRLSQFLSPQHCLDFKLRDFYNESRRNFFRDILNAVVFGAIVLQACLWDSKDLY